MFLICSTLACSWKLLHRWKLGAILFKLPCSFWLLSFSWDFSSRSRRLVKVMICSVAVRLADAWSSDPLACRKDLNVSTRFFQGVWNWRNCNRIFGSLREEINLSEINDWSFALIGNDTGTPLVRLNVRMVLLSSSRLSSLRNCLMALNLAVTAAGKAW